jgi:glycyl-tRNA synthetase
MFKTSIGVTEDSSSVCYLRPETAQGIFVNFANIARTTRKKLPFGVCQVGKAFRNEITPGNFIFRTREFEQMECEFFCKPGTDLEWFEYWKNFCKNWLLSLGMKEEHLRFRDHEKAELAFYSRATADIEYTFPFTDWGEVWGIADRTDYDLSRHQEASGRDLSYFDQDTNERYIPYVIEPSLGCDRVMLAFLCEAYDEEVVGQVKKGNDDIRTVLHLHPALAPFKAAILPLSKKEILTGPAMELYTELCKEFPVDYDETGSIGKRYRREDEIGTPFCITFNFNTVGTETDPADHCVTVRDRDTMEQVRIPISEVKAYISERIKF